MGDSTMTTDEPPNEPDTPEKPSLLKRRSQKKLGYIRLRGELLAYQAELKRAAERAKRPQEKEPPWLDEAMDLLDKAEKELDNGKFEEGWSCLNAARRVELDSLDSNGTNRIAAQTKALGVQAGVILAEANALLDPWVRKIITTLVADKFGQPRADGDLSITEVRAARYILDREHQQSHLRQRYVQEQLEDLTLVGVASLTLFVFLTLAGGYIVEGLSSPIVGSQFSPFQPDASQQSWFIVYVLLTGTIGASLFGIISSIGADPRYPLPQTISSRMLVVARILIGTMSAFVLFLFIQSGFMNLGGIPEAGILLIALAAGYSERLAPRTLDTVSNRLGTQIERDEEILSRLDTLLADLRETTDSTGSPRTQDGSDSSKSN